MPFSYRLCITINVKISLLIDFQHMLYTVTYCMLLLLNYVGRVRF